MKILPIATSSINSTHKSFHKKVSSASVSLQYQLELHLSLMWFIHKSRIRTFPSASTSRVIFKFGCNAFLSLSLIWINSYFDTEQKMKFVIDDFPKKRNQICWKLRIWSHLLKESLMKNFIFCAMWFLISLFWSRNNCSLLYSVESVRIQSYFDPHFPSISPFSVQMWENTDQNNSEYGQCSTQCYTVKFCILRDSFFCNFFIRFDTVPLDSHSGLHRTSMIELFPKFLKLF